MTRLVSPLTGNRSFGARWPAIAVALAAVALLVLGSVAVASYSAAARSGTASLHAALAQRHLQTFLRGVNEVLLTEGSTSSRQLVKVSGEAFATEITGLISTVGIEENKLDLLNVVLPAWKQISDDVKTLLGMKGLSASDDTSMLAYGKISGRAELLVESVAGIEARAAPVAAKAAQRMRMLVVAASAVALLFVLAVGRLVMQLMFNRLGDRPENVRAIAMQLASHDLTVHISDHGADQRATLLDALRDIRNNLVVVVGHVQGNANRLARTAVEIARGSQDLSNRTEKQAVALEETTSSIEQLIAAVRQNAHNAIQANQLALSATTVAAQGGVVVGQVVETIRGISESSGKIADIIGVIDSFAFQTNILALNAAVEAAHAGEHGRGFAVVATAVRDLAQRSAEAATEVKGLIATSAERIAQGTSLVDQAGETMQHIVASVKRVTEIMGEISTASSEQSASVSQIGEAVGRIDQTTQENAALVEESAAAAESLKRQAQQMVHATAVFKLPRGESSQLVARVPAAVATPGPSGHGAVDVPGSGVSLSLGNEART